MNYNTLNKNQLIEQATKLEQDLKLQQQATTNALQVANYFGANLEAIESKILNSPLAKKKFFATLWFFVTNYKEVAELLQSIKLIIEEWRKKIEEIKVAQNAKQD